jgi:hypothetical protein
VTAATPTTVPAVDLPEIDGGAVRINPKAPAEQVRVVVAYLGDQPITVPKLIPGNLMFDALRVFRRAGTMAMVSYMVEESLGADQTAALSNADGMTAADLRALLEKVGKLYQGQVDELLGN